MSWEGFWLFVVLFLALFIGVPFALVVMLVGVIVAVISAVCAVPVGMVWALAAMVRPEIVTSRKRKALKKETEGTDCAG